MTETISRTELERAIGANDVTVVETLRDEHFEQGHLPGRRPRPFRGRRREGAWAAA